MNVTARLHPTAYLLCCLLPATSLPTYYVIAYLSCHRRVYPVCCRQPVMFPLACNFATSLPYCRKIAILPPACHVTTGLPGCRRTVMLLPACRVADGMPARLSPEMSARLPPVCLFATSQSLQHWPVFLMPPCPQLLSPLPSCLHIITNIISCCPCATLYLSLNNLIFLHLPIIMLLIQFSIQFYFLVTSSLVLTLTVQYFSV